VLTPIFLIGQKKEEVTNVIEIEKEIEFRPKIHKPELLSTLSRKRLKIRNLERNKDLIPEILDTVNEKPF
jgi:DNA topoisomerase VI subunit B